MSTEDIKTKYGIDTTDFKTGVAQMNRALRVLNSEFEANAATMGDWAKTATGLEARNKTLSEKMDVQRLKVSALGAEYERFVREQGASSAAAQNAQIEYNKATGVLNGMQSEVNKNNATLAEMNATENDAAQGAGELGTQAEESGKKVGGMNSALEGLKKTGETLKSGLKTLAVGITAIAGAVAAVGGAITKLVLDGASSADALVEMSDKTGISTERLQEMQYIASQTGTDLETMTGSMSKLTRSMDASKTNKDMASAFKELGVKVKDSKGNLLDSKVVFDQVIDALGKVSNETERDALAMQIFGKSAQELNPLIKTGSDGLAELAAQARNSGAVMSESTVSTLAETQDKLDGMKASLAGTMGTLAAAFAPGFSGVLDQAQGYISTFTKIIGGGNLADATGGVRALINKILFDVRQQLPGMVQMALDIIKALIDALIAALPGLITVAISLISMLINFLVENLPMLVEAAIQIIVALALGIAQAIPLLIPVITKLIPDIILILLDNLPLLIGAALKIITALIVGIVQAIPVLVKRIPEILAAMEEALVASIPLIVEAGRQILLALLTTITDNLPALTDAANLLLYKLRNAFTMEQILLIGGRIVDGIWQGIQNNGPAFLANIKAFFKGMLDGVKALLGIKSPSTVFAGIGQNMAAGLGVGFGKQFNSIERQIRGSVAGMAGNLATNGAGMNSQTNFYLTAQYGYQAAGSLAEEVRLLQLLNGG